MNKKYIVFLLIIIIAGVFLRIFPVRYGSVRMYDNQLVTQAFDLGEPMLNGDFSVFKTPVKYPYFFSYILLFFYGIFYVFGRLIGLFSSGGEFINYIFFHLDGFYDFARILIGIFGTLLIPLVFAATRKAVLLKDKSLEGIKKSKIAGLLASFLMAFNLLHVHFSHQERSHILVSFFVFLSFYLFILFLEKKSFRNSLLLGLSIGLAAGSLQNGLIALVFLVLVVVFDRFKPLKSIKFWSGLLIFAVLFFVFYPFIFLSFNEVFGLWGDTFHTKSIGSGASANGIFLGEALKQIFVYQPVLIILLIVLLICFLFTRKKEESQSPLFKKSIVGAGLFVLIYVLLFGFFIRPYHRMLAPLSPFLCFLVGMLFISVFYSIKNKKTKTIFLGFLFLFLLFSFVGTLRFSYLIFNVETRDLAKDWIEENIPKSDLIAIEQDYIRFTPNQKSLQIQSILEPDSLSRKDKFLLSLDNDFYPEGGRAVLRFWTFKYRDNIYQFLKEQEVDYFVFFKSGAYDVSESGLDSEIISKGGSLIKVFSPFIDKDFSSYSNFPSEFQNPLIDLWSIKNLGPVVEIYKL